MTSAESSTASTAIRLAATGLALATFVAVTLYAWQGRLGLLAAGLFIVSCASFYAARRHTPAASVARIDTVAKTLLTVIGMIALLRHPISVDGQTHVPVYEAIIDYIGQVDGRTFVIFAFLAMALKFVGVIASAYAWHLLLIGQGIRFPFWSQTFTAFLIGRFIGTILPSTIGLDGYTLYEAGHYSNQWSRAGTAKMLEKIIGITGLFIGMALTLPFGYAVIQDVTTKLGRPETAFALAAAIGAVAVTIPVVVVTLLARPTLLVRSVALIRRVVPRMPALTNVERALHAYHGQLGLLLRALFAKFITHYTTASVYYLTALAIGVTGARYWPITFGSTIQVLATLLSPTIAGEGAREAFQALLLSNQLGGVAQAVLSAALGFIAAEAATLWGGIFIYSRSANRRPRYTLVDGKQVDYAWLEKAPT